MRAREKNIMRGRASERKREKEKEKKKEKRTCQNRPIPERKETSN